MVSKKELVEIYKQILLNLDQHILGGIL